MSMNLVQMSSVARKIIAGTIIFVLLLIVFYISRPGLQKIYLSLFPPDDPPTPIFGLLEPLEFIEKRVVNPTIRFELNTQSGRLPGNIPEKLTVYTYVESGFSFSAGKDAQRDASVLGFTDADLTSNLEGDVYTWRNAQFGSELEIIINTGELEKITNLTNKGTLYPTGILTAQEAIKVAEELVTNLNRYEDELYIEGSKNVTLGKFVRGEILETSTALDAQIAKVDFTRKIKTYPILGPDPTEGLMTVTLGMRGRGNVDFLNVKANYWEINPTSNATYPIISVTEAWNAVSSGQGVIASVTSNDKSPFEEYKPLRVERVLINKIYIAYYDSKKPQKYLQPIYVFEGNYISSGDEGDIVIYFPALDGSYIKENSTNNSGSDDPLF